MDVPRYDGKESVSRYIRRVEQFKHQLQEHQYNLILQFINELLTPEYKYTSLSAVRNVPYSLLTNMQHARQLLDNYTPLFKEHLDVVILSAEDLAVSLSDKSEEIQQKKIKEYPIKILAQALRTINYKLLYNSNKGYAIKMYKSNINS